MLLYRFPAVFVVLLAHCALSANTERRGLPKQPRDVTVKDCSNYRALVSWVSDSDSATSSSRFYVQYNTSFTPKIWTEAAVDDSFETETWIKLSPYANYTFRVIEENKFGRSEPSIYSWPMCSTQMDIPYKNPSNVHTDTSETGWLIVKWDMMPKIEHNGEGLQYVIHWSREDLMYASVTIDWKTNIWKEQTNDIYKPYKISVMARNVVGNSLTQPLAYTGYSGEGEPTVVPSNFELVRVNESSAVFQWDHVDTSAEAMQGHFTGYKITVWKAGERDTTEQETMVALTEGSVNNKEHAAVNNLPLYTSLEAEVQASNTHFDSPASNIVAFRTHHEAIRPPKILGQPNSKFILYKSGESVQITCVADGTPESRYFWKHNGRDFPVSGQDDHVVQLPNVGTLLLNNIEEEYEGTYQCFADNGYGISASVKVNLRQALLKTFQNESRKIHKVETGQSLTLQCVPPPSIPPAEMFWALKGTHDSNEPVYLDNRVSMDLEGRLHFTNVKKSDEQDGRAYVCMAMNKFVRASVTGPESVIEVTGNTEQRYAVRELWTSPKYQIVLKGETLKLKCIFAGNPTPDVNWKKVGGTLPDRARFESFGLELHINDVEESDDGQYECAVHNSESPQTVTKVFDILVEAKPEWVDKPQDVEVNTHDDATFICKATGIPPPNYTWYINGVPIDDIQNDKSSFQVEANTITFTDVTIDDRMNVQCNANNRYDYLFADVYLNIKDPPKDVKPDTPRGVIPDPPRDVTVKSCSNFKAVISWARSSDTSTDGTRYIVQYNTSFTSDVWTEAAIVNDSSVTEAEISLSPYANYTFRVIEENNLGRSEPSAHTLHVCSTEMNVPYKNPSNVHTDTSETGKLIVKWDIMPEIEHNGQGFEYNIRLSSGDGSYFTVRISNWKINTWIRNTNDVYQPYTISVAASNVVGYCMMPRLKVIGYSGEGIPKVVPSNFELVDVNSSSAVFQWDSVDQSAEAMQGKFWGYKIRVWKAGERKTTERVTMVIGNHMKEIATINNVPSGSDLEAEVQASNTHFDSPASNIVAFTTSTITEERTVIAHPPGDLKVIRGFTETFYCRVSRVPNTQVTWKWSHRRSPADTSSEISANANRMIWPDGSLTLNAIDYKDIGEYKCHVTSSAGNDTRTGSLTIVEAPQSPYITRVTLHDETAVIVKWFMGFDGNTPITKLNVQYREVVYGEDGQSHDLEWIPFDVDVKPSVEEVTVTGLSSARYYQFRVFAYNEVGQSAPSEPSPKPAIEMLLQQ